MKKILFLFLLIPIITIAQDFEVSPVIMNFTVEPGNNEVKKLFLKNHSDKKQEFSLKLSDYEVDSLGDKRKVVAGSSKRSLSSMIDINPSYLILNPNEQTFIDVILTVPDGEYDTKWGIISVQATQEKTSVEVDKNLSTGIMISPRIAVNVTQSPKSNKNYKCKITKFTEFIEPIKKDTLIADTSFNGRIFIVDVYNSGDKEVKGEVTLILSDLKTGKETKLDTKSEKLHPLTKKQFKFTLKDLDPGKYALAAILDIGHNTDLEGAQIIIEQK